MATLDANARVTAVQVMEIISTSLSEEQINAFINTAHHVVEDRLGDAELGETLLTDIELWLSAHFLATRDQRAKSETVAEYSVTYQGNTDMGLKATIYGQQALALDYTGTLAALGLKKATLNLV